MQLRDHQKINEQTASVVRLLLTPSQAKEFWPMLQESEARTQIKGLLCTINSARQYGSDGNLLLPGVQQDYGTLLELQVATHLDKATTSKIQELIRVSNQKHSPGS